MRPALLFAITAWVLSATPHATAATKSDFTSLLVSGDGLIRQKQPVPDDPLAGLPTGDGDQSGGAGSAKATNKGSRSCRLDARPANARDVGDLRATLAFVKRGPQAWACPQSGPASDVRLRVTVDVDGRITNVEPAGGDAAIAGGLAKKLVGQSITPRPEGPTKGTVVLSFTGHKK
jgi:hypothetical protein